MQSPAKKHKQHVMSRMTLATNGTADGFGSAHDMLKLKMVEDRRTLKTLQSIKAKIGDAMLYVNCPINHLMPSLLNRECMFKSGIAAVMNHETRISNN